MEADRELLVMRHAKSDWSTGEPDFSRPLSDRGHRDAQRMASWLYEHRITPDRVLTSSAKRAADTAGYVIDRFEIPEDRVQRSDDLYLANLWTWLEALEGQPAGRILVCGHNPGLDDLVSYLSPETPPLSASGKLMTTAAVARFAFDDEWSNVGRATGRLLQIVRPREL